MCPRVILGGKVFFFVFKRMRWCRCIASELPGRYIELGIFAVINGGSGVAVFGKKGILSILLGGYSC